MVCVVNTKIINGNKHKRFMYFASKKTGQNFIRMRYHKLKRSFDSNKNSYKNPDIHVESDFTSAYVEYITPDNNKIRDEYRIMTTDNQIKKEIKNT